MRQIIIAQIALSCALLFLAGCGDADSEAKMVTPVKAIKVAVSKVVPVTLKDTIILPGQTEPDKDVCVSSDSTGTVIWLGAEEGDMVEEGAILARLDVASSGARVEKAKAARKLAAEQVRRRRELLNKGVLAQEEFDQMEAELARSNASLREMQVNAGYGVVRAPITGIINKCYVDRGERLSAGAMVVDIVDPSVIRTTINVPEMDIPFIAKNHEVTISIDAIPDQTWTGVVEFVSFKADEGSKTFEVRVLTDNKNGLIRAGMLARVSLLRRSIHDTITAPLFAMINEGGERLLYVEEEGVARARTVQIGVIEKDRAQILEGLEIGDNLIVAGHTMVEDGMKVVVQ